MNNKGYIGIPIGIALFIEILYPYMKYINCRDVWFSPPTFFCILMFVGSFILFGVTLYKSRDIGNNDIYGFTFTLVALNILWALSFRGKQKYTIALLFLSLLFGYFTYNEVFLSSLTDNENTLYLNLYSAYIIWIGFMITIVVQYNSNKHISLTKN